MSKDFVEQLDSIRALIAEHGEVDDDYEFCQRSVWLTGWYWLDMMGCTVQDLVDDKINLYSTYYQYKLTIAEGMLS